jgi:hypothetical protein
LKGEINKYIISMREINNSSFKDTAVIVTKTVVPLFTEMFQDSQ